MEHHHWELLVVNYLYLGGLGAGLFVFSAVLSFMRSDRYQPLARMAALISPWPVLLGAGLLIFDLGSPMRFWRLFVTVQWTSPMSVGSWLLIVFSGISFVHMLAWRFPDEPARLGRIPLPGAGARLAIRRFMAAIGLPTGVAVGIYTGVLLGAVPARPFWNTPMVAMLFLFSALSTAAAVLILVSHARSGSTPPERFNAERRFLFTADIVIIAMEIFLIMPYLLHNALSTASQARSLELILGGPYTQLFWVGFVGFGIAVPLIVEVLDLIPLIAGRKQTHHFKVLGYVSGVLVLVGGYLLRYVFVFAGQESHFG